MTQRKKARLPPPTPDGRSSRVGAGQREAERPLPRGREETNGTTGVPLLSVRDGCPNAGYGVVGGKGRRKPLPPAPRREATRPRRRAEAASQRRKKGKEQGSHLRRRTDARPASTRDSGRPNARCRAAGRRPTVRPASRCCPSGMSASNAGYGVVGGKGRRKPLPPAPRREATTLGRRAASAIQRTNKRKKKENRPRSASPPHTIRNPSKKKKKGDGLSC